jgi:hypothetical protein
MDGDFENALNYYNSSLSAGASIDYSRGKVFGWMIGYNKFNKSILFNVVTLHATPRTKMTTCRKLVYLFIILVW